MKNEFLKMREDIKAENGTIKERMLHRQSVKERMTKRPETKLNEKIEQENENPKGGDSNEK